VFVNRLINQGNLPVVEQVLRFTAARHEVLARNVVNLTTPGYRAEDLDEGAFQKQLRDRVDSRVGKPISSVRFENMERVSSREKGLLFHDGSLRDPERLMTELAKNGLKHNLYVELMRRQFSSMDSALKERVG
jgi:flagellar basal-body rod protein FlgB